MKPIIIIAMSVLLLSQFTWAEVYQWRDENGKVHFGDKPTEHATKVKIRPEHRLVKPSAKENKSAESPNDVVMYVFRDCAICKQASAFFKAQKIPFIEYDIQQNKQGREAFIRLRGTSLPLIIIGKSRRLDGFSEGSFMSLYDNKE